MIERKVNRKAYPLNKVYKMKKESDVFVVGIVSDVSSTKKGHKGWKQRMKIQASQ